LKVEDIGTMLVGKSGPIVTHEPSELETHLDIRY
jgi:hypothetical protein